MNKDVVFISYSRHDSVFVDKLSGDLRQQGIDVWIDKENILPGKSWQQEIEQGLEKASSLIFILSKSSVLSQWMLSELDAFLTKNKSIFPVIIEDVELMQLPPSIRNIQWIDFQQSYKAGLQLLLHGLLEKIPVKKPIPQKPKKSKGYAFLSYADEDIDFISSLRNFLKKKGYAYWDYAESDRDYHNHFFLELEGIIIEASATLSVLSEAWKRSKWAIKEYFFSEEVGTPVFLLKAKKMGPTLVTSGMTYIDFIEDMNSGFRKLDRELKRKKL